MKYHYFSSCKLNFSHISYNPFVSVTLPSVCKWVELQHTCSQNCAWLKSMMWQSWGDDIQTFIYCCSNDILRRVSVISRHPIFCTVYQVKTMVVTCRQESCRVENFSYFLCQRRQLIVKVSTSCLWKFYDPCFTILRSVIWVLREWIYTSHWLS